MSGQVELAIELAIAAGGAFLVLVTAGRQGGYLVQPRTIVGVPVGPSPTPGAGGQPGAGGGGEGEDKPKPKPADDKPGAGEDKPKPADDKPGAGGGQGGGEGGGQTDDTPVFCNWNMLNPVILADTAKEAEKYARGRVPIPWPAINSGPYNIADPEVAKILPVGDQWYYITGVVLHTLLQQGEDPIAFANGGFFFPGCLIPGGQLQGETPLGKLLKAYKEGVKK